VIRTSFLTAVLALAAIAAVQSQGTQSANESLWEAARAGDTARITAALNQGADVNAKSRYDVTALIFAAGSGRLDAVKLLVARGADVNAQDTFYRARAADMALTNGHSDVVLYLVQNGTDADGLLIGAVQLNQEALLKAAVAGKVTRQGLQSAMSLAATMKREPLAAVLKTALDQIPAEPPAAAANAPLARADAVAAPAPTPAPAPSAPPPPPSIARRETGPRNWPAFRGEGHAGNGDGQRAVVEWDVVTGKNIKWKTAIPGIANSSPIVWGDRVFVTSAIGKGGDNTFRTGLYGDVKPVDDLSVHEWKIYSLDKATGRIVWERTANSGVPKTKRHTKSSQASSTPVTDGRRVVAVFGSAGLLVAWDDGGRELWRVDLGALDSGWFFDPAFQWGHSSSPVMYRNSVILQADMQKGSYIAAWDLATGKLLWKTERADEISTWGTPTIARRPDGSDEIVTNGTKIRGYDAETGKQLWTLGPNSEITIGTPVTGNGLVFVTGGYPPVRPIYAIRPGASGDISLAKGQDSNQAIQWSNMNEGTYIPTPIFYDGYLFTLNINGIVSAYDPSTGQRAFRGRAGTGGAFSASPVGADGHLYIASEDGEVYVLTAAQGLAQLAKNDMNEVIMATPAISDGLIVIRTLGHVFGIGQ
jgi:outer membrane protein assembly factor BamB